MDCISPVSEPSCCSKSSNSFIHLWSPPSFIIPFYSEGLLSYFESWSSCQFSISISCLKQKQLIFIYSTSNLPPFNTMVHDSFLLSLWNRVSVPLCYGTKRGSDIICVFSICSFSFQYYYSYWWNEYNSYCLQDPWVKQTPLPVRVFLETSILSLDYRHL